MPTRLPALDLSDGQVRITTEEQKQCRCCVEALLLEIRLQIVTGSE